MTSCVRSKTLFWKPCAWSPSLLRTLRYWRLLLPFLMKPMNGRATTSIWMAAEALVPSMLVVGGC